MDKFLVARPSRSTTKKRKGEEEESSPKKSKKASYVFVYAPGAGGGDNGPLNEVLGTLGRTLALKKWVGNFPSQMNANLELLKETAKGAKKEETLVYVGHSFGCRVIAEHLKTTNAPAIFESYPLFGPSKPKNAGTDRVLPLKALPSDRKVLFVNGSKDPFLNRDWLEPKAPRGIAAMEAVLAEADFTSTLLPVEGATHNTLKVAKKKQLANAGALRAAIVSYLDTI